MLNLCVELYHRYLCIGKTFYTELLLSKVSNLPWGLGMYSLETKADLVQEELIDVW